MSLNGNPGFSYNKKKGVAENIAIAILLDAGVQWGKRELDSVDVFIDDDEDALCVRLPMNWSEVDLPYSNVYVLKKIMESKNSFISVFSNSLWNSLLAAYNKAENHLQIVD